VTDVPLLLSYYEGKLSLLLRISQTRLGASYVTNAGLFQAVQESGLFSVDPDLGIGKYPSLSLLILAKANRDRQFRRAQEVLRTSFVGYPCHFIRCSEQGPAE